MSEFMEEIIEEPISYIMNVWDILHTDLIENKKENTMNRKLICYHINKSGKFPFIQILVKNEKFIVPFIGAISQSFFLPDVKENIELNEQINRYLQTLGIHLDIENRNKIEIKGCLNLTNTEYTFVDISQINIDGLFLRNHSKYWFALISEIVNNENICNISMSYEIIDFFKEYYHLFLLVNPKDKTNYPIPDVGYCGSDFKTTEFRSMFGLEKQKMKFGEYYCFTNVFKNALYEGAWSQNNEHEYKYGKLITDNEHGRYIEGGINRIAILSEKMTIVDELDLLEKQNFSHFINNEFESYDTIQISSNNPKIIINDYSQQMSLSYHKINKYTLDDKCQKDNTKYAIE